MPRSIRSFVAAAVFVFAATATAEAAPRNPYAGFNLSGINWGSQQWERDQRAGRVVWPYFNVPATATRAPVVRSGGGSRRVATVRTRSRRPAARQPSW